MGEGEFVWYELVTSDAAAAERFYAAVAGWSMSDAGMPGFRYTLASAAGCPVAGLMTLQPGMEQVGPRWFGYVGVADVDGAAARAVALGGAVHRPPEDIPGVGRFAVAGDPNGCVFMLFRGASEPPAPLPPGTPGAFGWNELITRDATAAFAFYRALFGWEKSTAVDMGPLGIYQTFATASGGDAIGGMMNGPEGGNPGWGYYITVDGLDAAVERLTRAGGTVRSGPHEVPGGTWIVNATDPQGAQFSLNSRRR